MTFPMFLFCFAQCNQFLCLLRHKKSLLVHVGKNYTGFSVHKEGKSNPLPPSTPFHPPPSSPTLFVVLTVYVGVIHQRPGLELSIFTRGHRTVNDVKVVSMGTELQIYHFLVMRIMDNGVEGIPGIHISYYQYHALMNINWEYIILIKISNCRS